MNAWSNTAFFLVGIWLLLLSQREKDLPKGIFGFTSILVGIGSFIFHATGTCFGAELDYFGMFLVTGVMTGLNIRRLWSVSWKGVIRATILTTSLLHAVACLLPEHSRLVFALGGPCCLLEIILWVRQRQTIKYNYYGVSWLMMGLAFMFWLLDRHPALCPSGLPWWNGHAYWHVFTAFSFLPLALFYCQFRVLKTP